MTATLEDRVRALEDVLAIVKFTAAYARAVDKGWDGKQVDLDRLPPLFTSDARWTCAALQVDVTGIDALMAMLKQATAQSSFAMHSFTNPIIDLDGDRARATWLLWVGIKAGDKADQVYQSEDLVYVRVDGRWAIQSIDLHFGQMLNS